MKKAIKLILPLFLISLIFATQTVQGTYNVTVNSVYNFDVISSETNLTLGVDTASMDGFEIGGHDFAENTTVSLNVTEVTVGSVSYNISSGGYSEIRATSALFDPLDLSSYLVFPILLADELSFFTWNQTEAEDYHLGIFMIPFLDVQTTTWEMWMSFADEIHENSTMLSQTLGGGLIMDAKTINSTSDLLFEFYLTGTIQDTITSGDEIALLNITIEQQMQFAYDKNSGVMLGMRMEGSASGYTNGSILEFDYLYHTEKVGYDLPAYDLGGPTWPFPGFELLIALGAITSVAVLVIIRKRK